MHDGQRDCDSPPVPTSLLVIAAIQSLDRNAPNGMSRADRDIGRTLLIEYMRDDKPLPRDLDKLREMVCDASIEDDRMRMIANTFFVAVDGGLRAKGITR